jgi:hypothetical protein
MKNIAEQISNLKTEAINTLTVQEELIWRNYQNTEAEIGCLEAAYFGTSIKHCHLAKPKNRGELAQDMELAQGYQYYLDTCQIKLGLWQQSLKAFKTDDSNLRGSLETLLQLINDMKTEADRLGLSLVATIPTSPAGPARFPAEGKPR